MTTGESSVVMGVLDVLKSDGAVLDSHPFPVGLDHLLKAEVG